MKQNNSPFIQLGLIILALVIIVGGGMFFFNYYREVNTTKEQLRTENNRLENRIQILSSSSGELEKFAETAYRSVPESNVGLFALNTIKNIVATEGLLIDSVFVNSQFVEAADSQLTEIGFDIEGESDTVLNFLSRVARSLPIVKLVEVETRVADGDFANSTITLEAYSKSLPDQLPSIKDQLPAITEKDRTLLNELTEYEYPQMAEEDPNVGEGSFGREDPFSPVSIITVE